MAQITITIPDEVAEEVNAAVGGKQGLIKWIKEAVVKKRRRTARETINADDLGLS